jgi:hypothetical protein
MCIIWHCGATAKLVLIKNKYLVAVAH